MSSRSDAVCGLLAVAASVVAVATIEADARAADRKGEVVGVFVDGLNADQVAGWLEDRVVAPDTLKEGDAFRAALRAHGALPLRLAVGNDVRDVQLVTRASAAARDVGVDHAVLVDVRPTARGTRVHVWHIDTRNREALVDTDVTLPPAATAVYTARAVLALAPPAQAAKVESPREPAPPEASRAPASAPASAAPTPSSAAGVAFAPEPDRAAAPSPRDDAEASLVSARASLGAGMRHFSYVDRITPSLRPYDLAAAPIAEANVVVYPLGLTRLPVARDFGITGSYGQAVALGSQDSAGNHVGTTWQTFEVGAVQRFDLGHGLHASVSGGYGGNDFQFTDSLAGGAATLPSVSYRLVRVGGDVRYRFLPPFVAWAGGSYLDVLSGGYVSELFPHESVGGLEGHLGASWRLAKSWEVSLSATYTRFFYSFNPVPGDALVAGGALDEQTRILAGFAYVM